MSAHYSLPMFDCLNFYLTMVGNYLILYIERKCYKLMGSIHP